MAHKVLIERIPLQEIVKNNHVHTSTLFTTLYECAMMFTFQCNLVFQVEPIVLIQFFLMIDIGVLICECESYRYALDNHDMRYGMIYVVV